MGIAVRKFIPGILIVLATGIAGAYCQSAQTRPGYQLVLVDREGHRTPVGLVPASTFAPRVSSDGRQVTFDTQDDGNLWVANLSDVASRRRITTEGRNRAP